MKKIATYFFVALSVIFLLSTLVSCTVSANAQANSTATPIPVMEEDIAAATAMVSMDRASSVDLENASATAHAQAALATPIPTQVPITGIHADGPLVDWLPPRTLAVDNAWQNYVGNSLVKVQAGKLKPDTRFGNPTYTEHGSIYVEVYGDDRWDIHWKQFETEDEDGSLSIKTVEVEDHRFVVHLESANGTAYRFDSSNPRLERLNS